MVYGMIIITEHQKMGVAVWSPLHLHYHKLLYHTVATSGTNLIRGYFY